ERLDKTIKAIPTTVKDKYMMVKSAPFFFEILLPKVSKGIALKQLADNLSIQPENIMCISDGDNDQSNSVINCFEGSIVNICYKKLILYSFLLIYHKKTL